MSDDFTINEQTVREMAKLALYSNKINEIQEKNLKMYPFVFFDNIRSVSVDYDFTNRQTWDTEENQETLDIAYKPGKLDISHHRVTYRLTLGDGPENMDLDKRFLALQNSVRNLFWKEVRVQVYFNETLKFESENVTGK